MVLSTHLLGDVEQVCEQVVMLNSGRLLASGRIQELNRAGRPEVVVRVKGSVEAFTAALSRRGIEARRGPSELRVDRPPGVERALFEAALESGVQIRYIAPAIRSVEDLFLQLVDPALLGRNG
jgi:ABC-2 type transport system ATP-binding protein